MPHRLSLVYWFIVRISLRMITVDVESNGCQHRQARAVEVRVCRAPISGSRKKQESTAECINESSDENRNELMKTETS